MNFNYKETPPQEKKTEKIQEGKEQFKMEIDGYESLLEQLKTIGDIKLESTSPKVSLAFLIEEMKKKNTEGWQEDLKKFRERIDQVAKAEGKVGVTWLISEAISSAYIEFLESRKQQVQDESLRRKLEIIKKMAEQSLEFNRKAHEQGQPVSFGGVSLDYVPKWYYYVVK